MVATFRKRRNGKAAAERGSQAVKQSARRVASSVKGEEPPIGYFTPTSPEPTLAYSFLEEWNRGVIPKNKQLLEFFSSWESAPMLAADSRLSPAGLSLVRDVKELGRLLTQVIQERNKDELIQRFIGHIRLAGSIIRRGPKSGRVTLIDDRQANRRVRLFGRRDAQIKSELVKSRQDVKGDAQELLSLGQLVVTSVDFRTLLQQIQTIVKRIIDLRFEEQPGTARGEAKEREREPASGWGRSPTAAASEERPNLRQPSPAPAPADPVFDRPWPVASASTPGAFRVSRGAETTIGHGLPEVEQTLAEASEHVEAWRHPEQFGSKTFTTSSPGIVVGGPSAGTSAAFTHRPAIEIYSPTARASPHAESRPGEPRYGHIEERPEPFPEPGRPYSEGTLYTAAPGPAKPEERQRPTTERREQSREERAKSEQDKILEDAKPIFRQLSDNPDFFRGLQGIWAIMLKWQQRASDIPGTALPSELQYDANFAAAQVDFLRLMERFANGASLEPLLQSLRKISEESLKDYELADFMGDWRSFITRCIEDPNYMDHDEYYRRGNYLLNRTTEYSERKYRRLFHENIEHWNDFVRGLQNDKITAEVSRLLARIVNQDLLGLPEGGAPAARGLLNLATIPSGLINDLRIVILPAMIKSLYELPLPHMEVEQDGMRIALDDVVLPGALFTPADVNITTRSALHLSPRAGIFGRRRRVAAEESNRWRSGSHVSITGMRGDIKDVRFALDRRAFPRIRDRGTMDVRLAGKGLSIAVEIISDISAAERRFHLEPAFVRVNLDRLLMKFYGVEHDTLFAILRPYLQYTMKARLERVLCDRIVDVVRQVNTVADRLTRGISRSGTLYG